MPDTPLPVKIAGSFAEQQIQIGDGRQQPAGGVAPDPPGVGG